MTGSEIPTFKLNTVHKSTAVSVCIHEQIVYRLITRKKCK